MSDRDIRQHQCIEKWVHNKCKGCIEGCTGFGKTRVALNAISMIHKKYPNLRILVVVPTDLLQRQWRAQLEERMLSEVTDVEVINTVIKHEWNCSILVLDEIHRYAADSFKQLFTKVKYHYILGLTATFSRLDGKHELISKYCPIIDVIPLAEALVKGWVSPYTEYEVIIDVPDIEVYDQYQREFNEHFEFFNWDFNLIMSMTGPRGYINQIKYRDELCENKDESYKKNILKAIKNHVAGFMRCLQARKKFINNHPKKLEITRKIIEARYNKKIITFSNNVKMAESIGIGSVYTGRLSKKKGRITIDEFNQQKDGVLNTVAKANEGMDIHGLSVAIILGLDSSQIKATQRTGRVIRFEDNKNAEIFNIVINHSVETEWFKKSHSRNPYVVIDENNLDKVLKGLPYEPYKKPIQNLMFRF